MEIDPVVFHDWHPVAAAAALTAGVIQPVRLLEHELIIWRSADGAVHAWDDRCPHRGARLSLGHVTDDQVICAYHGWRFDGTGQCRFRPAQPDVAPPAALRADRFHAAEAHGLVWVSLGEPARDLPPLPEHGDARLRSVICGPYQVHTSGPRIIENFLDMAHFSFVHVGILGDAAHTEIEDYKVAPFDDGLGDRGMRGLIATECFAYQPQPGVDHDTGGTMVEYTYRIVRPLTAVLTKHATEGDGVAAAISIHAQPLDDETTNAWMVVSAPKGAASDDDVRARQEVIFFQDVAILESQRPKRLPLAPGLEVPQRADRLSAAYRRLLQQVGLRYGVSEGGGSAPRPSQEEGPLNPH
jgi:phenylpropionate dioxygenase-like ring-hydroxylating dioxygenase large terminal subunit